LLVEQWVVNQCLLVSSACPVNRYFIDGAVLLVGEQY
jgi:hypothetical protein